MLPQASQPEMLSSFLTPHAALAALGLAALYLVVKRALRRSIAHLPGPHSNSWLLGAQTSSVSCFVSCINKRVGNAPDFQRSENAGEADFRWSGQHGLAFRTKACFGVSSSCTWTLLIFTHVQLC